MDRSIYVSERSRLSICNLLAYNRLAYGHMLLMEYVWLMNYGSTANEIIYDPEGMEIEPYIILIFLFDLYRYIYHLG
jgi:hypothetical protein